MDRVHYSLYDVINEAGHSTQHCVAASVLLIIVLLSNYKSGANMQLHALASGQND